ncbi:unnamed protein product [Laminaria digitata]
MVLGTGRTIIAVVSDGAKRAEVDKELDTACGEALECGHFVQLSRPPKRVGPGLRPNCVPIANMSESILCDVHTYDLADAMDEDDDDDDDDGKPNEKATKDGTPLVVAKKHADMFGVDSLQNVQQPIGKMRECEEGCTCQDSTSIPTRIGRTLPPLSTLPRRSPSCNASEGVVFKLSRTIQNGEELLGYYPISPGSKGVEGAGSADENGGGGSEGVDDADGDSEKGGGVGSQDEEDSGDPEWRP